MSLFKKNGKAPSGAKEQGARAAAAAAPARSEARDQVKPLPNGVAPKANAPTTPLGADEARKAARQSQQLHLALGQIVTVLMNAPEFQKLTLENLKALAAPAVLSGQYIVAMAKSAKTGHLAPAAVAFWASVSDDVDKRLSQDLDKFSIAAKEWRSGEHAWLVMLAGDRRALNPMLAKLQKTTLRGRPLKMRAQGKDGKVAVHAFSPAATAAPPPTA